MNKNQNKYLVEDTLYCPVCGEHFVLCECFIEWDHPHLSSQGILRADWQCQSSEILVVDDNGTGADTKQETVQFHEGSSGSMLEIDHQEGAFIAEDTIDDATLATFLSRPVRIANFNWLESSPINVDLITLNPWALFFGDEKIKYKLNNFAYIRANLHIKILLNASPFYYGACICAYQPLQNFTPSTIVDDGSSRRLIPLSQRPHVWLQPQKNEGAEMVLPFMRQTNWLTIRSLSDFTDMGALTFVPYTSLDSANATVGTGVSIQVYAWAEDVQLSGTTTALSLQSQETDEYGNGPISAPASYVARLASYLTKAPLIGRWATATQIGASAVSSIAKLFGFTNVPVIEDTHPYRVVAFPQLASTEIGYPTEKLTVDAKNELSVDPGIIGLPSEDELVITKFAGKDSYITRIDWSTSDAVDKLLIKARVTPNMFRCTSDAVNSNIYFTPIAYASQMFEYWRGDIIFRFEFQVSTFHKGRVRISFDPQGDVTNNLITTTNTSNVVYTEIVDLSVHTSYEMRVPYQQALPYLQVPQSLTVADQPVDTTATFNVNRATDNGLITMRVLNTLTAPVATSGISILMFVRAADNFELANPTSISPTFTPFQVQSEEVCEISTTLGTNSTKLDNARALVNFGETIISLRTLMRRQCITHAISPTFTTTARYGVLSYKFHKIPPYPGFDPSGIYFANRIVVAGTAPYNYANFTPLTWINLCFVGYRGSVQWHFAPITPATNVSSLQTVSRIPQDPGASNVSSIIAPSATTSSNAFSANMQALLYDTLPGAAATNNSVQTGLSVQTPNYSNYIMQSTDPRHATLPVSGGSRFDGSYYDTFNYSTLLTTTTNAISTTAPTGTLIYNSIGTDYSPIFFLNCPVMFRQTSTPSPV